MTDEEMEEVAEAAEFPKDLRIKELEKELAKSQQEYAAMFVNLTNTQARCSVLLEGMRHVKRVLRWCAPQGDAGAELVQYVERCLNPTAGPPDGP